MHGREYGTTVVDVLADARGRLDGRGLLQGAVAVDKAGRKVRPLSEDADRWCSLGAINAAAISRGAVVPHGAPSCVELQYGAVSRLAEALGLDTLEIGRFRAVEEWHDSRESIVEVLAGFDAAIGTGTGGTA